ncbi:MAG: SurA N-terminal domain-containing protein [Lachnospiraceae bacterium]|nr:SurA N-terminal domain-containing protein [Lachnospiraceae bacterium]
MKKTLSVFILLIVSVFMLTACGDTGIFASKDDYIIKINDVAVGENEFKLYLYETQSYFSENGGEDIWETDFDGRTAEDVAKDSAINTVKMVKLSAQKANELGITLTEDELASAKDEATSLISKFSEAQKAEINLTEDEIYNIMQEKAIFVKVYNEIAQGYEVDEDEFSSYFDSDAETYTAMYTKFKVQEAIFETKEDAEKILSIGKDDDFLEKAKELGGDSYESEYYKGEMEDSLGINVDLEPGEMSSVIETDAGFYVFKLVSTEEPDAEATREYVKSLYKYNNSQEYFSGEFEKWTNAANIEINQKVLDKLSLTRE